MELSLSDGAGHDQQQVRVKLHFEDETILSAQQIYEGLRDSWFLLDAHLCSIADLGSHIEVAFGLRSACPHGISLRMECFTLPPCQPIRLLKDKDTVSIHRKGASVCASDQKGGHAHSCSLDAFEKIALLCGDNKAHKDFEGRTEVYEIEEVFRKPLAEHGDIKGLNLATIKSQEQHMQEKIQRKSKRISTTPSHESPKQNFVKDAYDKDLEKGKAKSREKKRKLEGHDLHYDTKDKKKMEKKQRREDQEDAAKEKKKSLTISEKDKHACTIGAATQQMNWSKKESSTDEEWKQKEESSQQPMDHETVKKCSRSTLRKKAKRRWKRANLELQKKETGRGAHEPVKAEIAHIGQGFAVVANKQEDDADAEEERLPHVVRPGHVRFQDSDEDGSPGVNPIQGSLPHLGWSHGISKKKGQSWGQQKTKRGNERSEAMVEMECDDIQELNPETLPVIEGTPQSGSVIAYRILTLTASCCPELSEYYVGRVLEIHSQSGLLKLACVPKYRIRRDNEEDSPVDEVDIIETEISSLADMRLVECSQLESSVHGPIELLDNEHERNSCNGTETDMAIGENIGSILTKAEPQIEKSDSVPYQGPDWLEITDAIQRKRDELQRQAEAKDVEVASHGNGQALENQHQPESSSIERTIAPMNGEIRNELELENIDQTTSAKSTEVKKLAFDSKGSSSGKASDGASAGRIRGWHRRAGGLGSTMALLRQSTTL